MEAMINEGTIGMEDEEEFYDGSTEPTQVDGVSIASEPLFGAEL